ncbi:MULTISPECIES: CAP domain-containing protein [Nostocales]|uniref:CAP domain-containing protein n=4 Tax=Nostocales TaxID=1161 RepID=A0A8S9T1Q0_9CYAN|nr:CAP domain-containing protein [Tolypothrix bouteillei]KAF3885917.1 CAP domain-containing protein [Tolypothrix bouteillei VB521301]
MLKFHIKSKYRSAIAPIIPVIGITLAFLIAGCEEAVEYLPPLPKIEVPSGKPQKPAVLAQTSATANIEAAVRQDINQVRLKYGLKPLQNNEKLAEVARRYSRQMAEKNFFSHTGSDGSTLSQRARSGGIIYWVVGENLFKSTNIPRPVPVAVDGWMKSPGHRENILRPIFKETGVGVWKIGRTYYITQLFLRG